MNHPTDLDAVQAHRRRQVPERLKFPGEWEMPDLAFTTTEGGPLDPDHVSNDFERAPKQAGLPIVRVHDLRHGAASLLLQAGEHPKNVSEMLGHRTDHPDARHLQPRHTDHAPGSGPHVGRHPQSGILNL